MNNLFRDNKRKTLFPRDKKYFKETGTSFTTNKIKQDINKDQLEKKPSDDSSEDLSERSYREE